MLGTSVKHSPCPQWLRKKAWLMGNFGMASALGRAALVGARAIPAAGASRRVCVAGARARGLKTNPHVEEWMGKREISEKTFTFTPKISLGLVMTCIVFPVLAYGNIKAGMETKDAKEGRTREYF